MEKNQTGRTWCTPRDGTDNAAERCLGTQVVAERTLMTQERPYAVAGMKDWNPLQQAGLGSTFHLHSVQGLSASSRQSFSSLKLTKFLSTFFCYRHTDFFFFVVIEVAGIARASELWYEGSLNL